MAVPKRRSRTPEIPREFKSHEAERKKKAQSSALPLGRWRAREKKGVAPRFEIRGWRLGANATVARRDCHIRGGFFCVCGLQTQGAELRAWVSLVNRPELESVFQVRTIMMKLCPV